MKRDKKNNNEVQTYLVERALNKSDQNTEAVLLKLLPTVDDIFKQNWLTVFECGTGKVGPCHTCTQRGMILGRVLGHAGRFIVIQ